DRPSCQPDRRRADLARTGGLRGGADAVRHDRPAPPGAGSAGSADGAPLGLLRAPAGGIRVRLDRPTGAPHPPADGAPGRPVRRRRPGLAWQLGTAVRTFAGVDDRLLVRAST